MCLCEISVIPSWRMLSPDVCCHMSSGAGHALSSLTHHYSRVQSQRDIWFDSQSYWVWRREMPGISKWSWRDSVETDLKHRAGFCFWHMFLFWGGKQKWFMWMFQNFAAWWLLDSSSVRSLCALFWVLLHSWSLLLTYKPTLWYSHSVWGKNQAECVIFAYS